MVRCKRVNKFDFRRSCDIEEHVSVAARQDSGSDIADAIAMPVANCPQARRLKLMIHHVYSACVPRPVTKKEAKSNAKAMAALDKEWAKLRNVNCWDESRVEDSLKLRPELESKGAKCT